MNKQRQQGFYWVKIANNEWIICYYSGVVWVHQGCAYNDENFKEIDENIIKR